MRFPRFLSETLRIGAGDGFSVDSAKSRSLRWRGDSQPAGFEVSRSGSMETWIGSGVAGAGLVGAALSTLLMVSGLRVFLNPGSGLPECASLCCCIGAGCFTNGCCRVGLFTLLLVEAAGRWNFDLISATRDRRGVSTEAVSSVCCEVVSSLSAVSSG